MNAVMILSPPNHRQPQTAPITKVRPMRLVALSLASLLVAAPATAQVGRNLQAVAVHGPTQVDAGQSAAFDLEVESTGDQATGNYQYRLLLTAGGLLSGATVLGTFSGSSIPAGDRVQLQRTVTIPNNVSGIFQVALVVDPNGTINERNELDNFIVDTQTLRVIAPSPDLSLEGVAADANEGRVGDTFPIDFTVRDRGPQGASVVVAAYLSPDEEITTSDVLLGQITVEANPLTPVSDRVLATIPAGTPEGRRYLGLLLDPDGATNDRTPADNRALLPQSFLVYADTLTLDTETITDATLGVRYEVHFDSTGGDGTHSYDVVQGALPDGLTLSTAGVLSGSPSRTGRFSFTVRVQSRGLSATRAYSAVVASTNAPLIIATTFARDGYMLMPYEQRLVAGGGEGPYSWFLPESGGLLPPGIDLTSEGVLSGLPDTLGTYNFRIGVRDRLGAIATQDYSVVITPTAGVLVLLNMPPPLPVGVPADFGLSATGGRAPYQWEALSRPPPGLTLSEDGHLRGTPTQVGEFKVRVRATGAGRHPTADEALIAVTIEEEGAFGLKSRDLPFVLIRSRYEAFLEAEGGVPPYEFRLVPGTSLPEGFYLTQEGVPEGQARIYGTGYRNESKGFAVRLEDSQGRVREVALALTIGRVGDSTFVEESCACTGTERRGAGLPAALLGLVLLFRRRRFQA